MQPSVRTGTVSKGSLWTGRIFVALITLFMLFDGGIKVLRMAPAVEELLGWDIPQASSCRLAWSASPVPSSILCSQ